MAGRTGGQSGPRSGAYSRDRFTNWTSHDPHWSEIEALPPRPRPVTRLKRGTTLALPFCERPISAGFHRPWVTADLAAVLVRVPEEFLAGLGGVYSMAGTAPQRRRRALTFGMYANEKIYLFPIPEERFRTGWTVPAGPPGVDKLVKLGARVKSVSRRGAVVTFDQESLRRFYLYDVLLHELGHHVGRFGPDRTAERYAHWFAELQFSILKSGNERP